VHILNALYGAVVILSAAKGSRDYLATNSTRKGPAAEPVASFSAFPKFF
jgi:hypothetical protein